MQFKLKSRILFIAFICLFCFQFNPEPLDATDDRPSQRKFGAQTVQTLKKQPAEPKPDDVLAIPGLPIKLRHGSGCADNAYRSLSRRVITTVPYRVEEACFGDTKGPDILHDSFEPN